jgi:tRNA(Met) C34 N-acetyltransferase TmcA
LGWINLSYPIRWQKIDNIEYQIDQIMKKKCDHC